MEDLQQDAQKRIGELEEKTHDIKVRFRDNGQYERYDKIKEAGGGRVVPPINNYARDEEMYDELGRALENQEAKIEWVMREIREVKISK